MESLSTVRVERRGWETTDRERKEATLCPWDAAWFHVLLAVISRLVRARLLIKQTKTERERGEGGVSTKRERKKERDDYHPREECGEDEKRGDSGAEGATWKG